MIKLDTKPFNECQILIVEDDTVSQTILKTLLADVAHCTVLNTGEDALTWCASNTPDLILMDMNLPGKSGTAVCEELKQIRKLDNVPVIFVTASIDPALEDRCWDAGAADFIVKPVTASTLLHRVKVHLQNKLRTELLENMMVADQLTGLYNRIYLTHEVPRLIRQLVRDDASVAVILLDIDKFKLYNDTYGHIEGDACLKAVAGAIKSSIRRPQDVAFRFGGEEFLVLLPDTDLDGATHVAQHIIENVLGLSLLHEEGINKQVTVSAGAAACKAKSLPEQSLSDLIERADQALYRAKRAGRNQLQTSTTDTTSEISETVKN